MNLQDYLAQLPDDPQRRGQKFEEKLEEILLVHEDFNFVFVIKFADWEYGGQDIGIDLVAKDIHGLWWAIQAKCFDPSRSIPKGEVDSFLTASSGIIESWGQSFDRRLLIGTASSISENARKVLRQANPKVVIHLFEALDSANLDWGLNKRKAQYLPRELRDYQELARESVIQGFQKFTKGQLIMACGTGKTITALSICESMSVNSVVLLVPSLQLLKQTRKVWQDTGSLLGRRWLAVCSDKTVSDDFDNFESEILDLGFSVTTKPTEIAHFLKANPRHIVFATYQSSDQIVKALELSGHTFDLVIADECHRTVGSLNSEFGLVLKDGVFKSKKKLFMTATPKTLHPNLKKSAGNSGIEVSSMDSTELYGPVLFNYSFAEAIGAGWLSPYKIVIASMTQREIENLLPRNMKKSYLNEVIVLRSIRDLNLKSVITYHSRLSAAEKFANSLIQVNEVLPVDNRVSIDTGFVHGLMRSRQKTALISRLSGRSLDSRYLLTNARCLTEGIDIPELDGIAFVDPRTSFVDIVQAVGRVIRKSGDQNKVGHIVIPILIDASDETGAAFKNSNYSTVWKVICALESHDEQLRIELQKLRFEIGCSPSQSVTLPDQISISLPASLENAREMFAKLSVRLVERVTSDWEDGFEHLNKHYLETGNSNPGVEVVDRFGYPIGRWCNTQRGARRGTNRGLLNEERIKRLDSIGFIWELLDAAWNEGYENLVEYKESFGHAMVPQGTLSRDDFRLGQWVQIQRMSKREGKLSADREHKLLELGFIFDVPEMKLEELLFHLKSFYQEFGTVNVPTSYVINGYRLGNKLDSIRQKIKREPNARDKVIDYLLSKDFILDVRDLRADTYFRKGLEELDVFVQTHKIDEIVQFTKSKSGFRLGSWLEHQRAKARRGAMPIEHEKELLKRKILINIKEAKNKERIKELKKFFKESGHINIPTNYKASNVGNLSGWLRDQKKRYREGLLSDQESSFLEELGIDWEIRGNSKRQEDAVKRFLEEYGKYQSDHGLRFVPAKYISPNGYRLGQAFHGYKVKRKNGNLSEDIVRQLDNHGFEWATPRLKREKIPKQSTKELESWLQFLSAFKRFISENGHTFVPYGYVDKNDFPLYARCSIYRNNRRRGNLSSEKIETLEQMGFQWSLPKPSNKGYSWNRLIAELESYLEEHGNLRIENDYKSPSGYALGSKARKLRSAFANGALTELQVERLTNLGFEWTKIRKKS